MDLPSYIKGAIFDLDGTILDSLHIWREVDVKFFLKRNMELPPEYLHAVKTMDLIDAAIYTKRTYSLPDEPEALVREWLEMVAEEYALRVEIKPHVREFLEKLWGEGVKLAVATSSSRDLFMPCLKRHGLDKFFSAYVETREAGRGKNFPDPYLLAAARLGLRPEECAVFEDILVGIRSAKQAGFFTVAVADPFSEADRAPLLAEADLFIDAFEEFFMQK